ncbi:type II toxin-antitoxin system RelE/ParE family toxin [bacterium]|nr:type II toxin-antitoxin system RelE/ParE family toxin [bacterium]
MKIVITESAAKELAAIIETSATDRSHPCSRSAEEWKRLLQQPAQEPAKGRMVPEFADERFREIIAGPCRMVYTTDSDQDLVTLVAVHLCRPAAECPIQVPDRRHPILR